MNGNLANRPIDRLAESWNKSEEEIHHLFMHENSLRLDLNWGHGENRPVQAYYVDAAPILPPNPAHSSLSRRAADQSLVTNALRLHSMPGASKVISFRLRRL
jgi:hypothetical protein